MAAQDVKSVLQIIAQYDEDDLQEAKQQYKEQGFEDESVLEIDGQVLGVTGASAIPGTDAAYELSWTYVDLKEVGLEDAKKLVFHVIDTLRLMGARKVFAEASDYFDPDKGDVYQLMRQIYQAVGFVEELRHEDYYDEEESLITFGQRIRLASSPKEYEKTSTEIILDQVSPIEETDDAYVLGWHRAEADGSQLSELSEMLNRAAHKKARVLFAAVPSTMTKAIDLLLAAGFRPDGKLTDYFVDGIDKNHFRFDFNN